MSSKFSRRPRIQQPPPVCKSKKPIIPIPPPPPPYELWTKATWSGECSDYVYRELEAEEKYEDLFPSDSGRYECDPVGHPLEFHSSINHPDSAPYQIVFGFGGWGWLCAAAGYIELPPEAPFSIGPTGASWTSPGGKTATFQVFTKVHEE